MHAELELLGGDQLLRVGDALLQRPGPAVPQPRVAEAVGPQLRRQWDPAAYVRAHEGGRLRRQPDLVNAGSALEHPQHLAEVRLAARDQVGHELVVFGRRELRDRGVQVIGHPARELRGLREQLRGQLGHDRASLDDGHRRSIVRRFVRSGQSSCAILGLPPLGAPRAGRTVARMATTNPLQAASTSLDVLLTDSAASGTRRFLAPGASPGSPRALARHPRKAAGRAAALGGGLARVAAGRSEQGPARGDRRFARPRVAAELAAAQGDAGLPDDGRGRRRPDLGRRARLADASVRRASRRATCSTPSRPRTSR